jgi:iron complex transport system permease protein
MGILAGLGLAVAGATMQGILRNPLASPTTLGVSAAAGLGAALALILGVGVSGGRFLLIGNAFLFALIPAGVIFALARMRRATPDLMILAGIGLLYIFSALTSLLEYFAAADALKSLVVWLMGDLGRAKWEEIAATALVLALCVPLMLWKAWDLNVMAAGDDTAKALGLHPGRDRLLLMGVAALITATIICFTGMIGFIGLVAPHICRMAVGGDHRYLVPASGLFGAAFLLFADAVARTLLAPVVIPVGIITACAGGPLFLYLVLTHKKRHW